MNHQQRKLEEEVYELQEAIIKGDDKEHIAEELADVCVLLMQITNYLKIDVPSIDKIMGMKIDRQIERIKNEKHDHMAK